MSMARRRSCWWQRGRCRCITACGPGCSASFAMMCSYTYTVASLVVLKLQLAKAALWTYCSMGACLPKHWPMTCIIR